MLCTDERELWSHKSSMFVVVIMKSKAEMSFGGEMFSCFCLAVHVIQKHDCDLDNLYCISDGKSSFIRGEAMEGACPHRRLHILVMMGGQKDQG